MTPSRVAVVLSVLLTAAPLRAQAQPDLTAAKSGLAEFQSICKDAGQRLWGVSLCGRVLLVEPKSRLTVANMPDPDGRFTEDHGLYAGTLPPELLLANTSVRWGNDDWAMVLLPLPGDSFTRLRLLAHESFHRAQPGLELNAPDASIGYMESESGRLWIRLELRALAQALRLDGAAARAAATDAMLFRAARQHLNPGGDVRESALEIQEGIPEYTGTAVALATSGESIFRAARAVESFEDQASLARSFEYGTGPGLGLLLDRYDSGWRKKLKRDSNPGLMLAQALGFREGADIMARAQVRGETYGYRAVAADEHARAVRTEAMLAGYRARFLNGPVLEFPRDEKLRRSFNPNNLMPLDDKGTVYPTGTFASSWGRLEINDVGGLLAPDNQALRVTAPGDPSVRPLTGPGWKLELAPGWTVRPADKAGDFIVARE